MRARTPVFFIILNTIDLLENLTFMSILKGVLKDVFYVVWKGNSMTLGEL